MDSVAPRRDPLGSTGCIRRPPDIPVSPKSGSRRSSRSSKRLPPTDHSARLTWASIAGLWCIAVAQPLLDVLGRAPEFFVAHRSKPLDIWLILAALVVVAPLLLALAVRFISRAIPRLAAPLVTIVIVVP